MLSILNIGHLRVNRMCLNFYFSPEASCFIRKQFVPTFHTFDQKKEDEGPSLLCSLLQRMILYYILNVSVLFLFVYFKYLFFYFFISFFRSNTRWRFSTRKRKRNSSLFPAPKCGLSHGTEKLLRTVSWPQKRGRSSLITTSLLRNRYSHSLYHCI